MSTHKEPAIKSYFFGKGYTDIQNVITESWERNLDSTKDLFSKIDKSGENWEQVLSFLFWGGAGISVVVFGTLFFLLISFFHIIFLGIFFLLIYILFSFLWIIERIYLFVKHFFTACPYCHKKSLLPEYLCSNCGAAHAKLMPNQYGILYHKCTCGQNLPATFFLNRGRLQARCAFPECNKLLHREHTESKRIFIPILGGPDSGKTTYMFSAVRSLIDEKAIKLGLSAEFIDSSTEANYNKVIEDMKRGETPSKTSDYVPKAFNLALKQNNKTKWLMYIYDPAGEAYNSTDDLSSLHYHEYLSGMILIVDPFSIPDVKEYYKDKLSSKVAPSNLSGEETLNRVILAMEQSFGLSATSKIKYPLAIVLSKVDAFDLDTFIGETAVDREIPKSSIKERGILKSNIIKKQLSDWNESAFLNQLDTRFKNTKFFSCSALGRIPNSSSLDLKGYDVLEPILWISKIDRGNLSNSTK